MARLEELLDLKDKEIQQKIADANEWARKYTELNDQLTATLKELDAKGDDATLVNAAQDLLHEGKLDEARKIYDRLIASDDANVDRAAQDHFARATIFALQFQMPEAFLDYAEAYQLRPHDVRYASNYGRAAYRERQYAEAERASIAALQMYRDLAARDPDAYRPDVAATLANLGNLYSDTGRFVDAEKAYGEALTVRRDLAARDPGAYKPDVAATLANLGNLYSDTSRLADAEKAFSEALAMFRDLAAHDPGAYTPEVAMTLNNLAEPYFRTSRFADAEKASSEALAIFRDLASRDSGAYTPYLAMTLNNLGNIYKYTGRRADAEKVLSLNNSLGDFGLGVKVGRTRA
jgi:tetratricopeptide (TPR) repeat protein